MLNSRFAAAILAAGLLAASACSDSTAPISSPGNVTAARPSTVTLYGTISRTGRDPLHGLVLTLEDGTEVPLLTNAETYDLSTIDGAGAEVHGAWDAGESFVVETFVVRNIRGTPVFDGVLVEERSQDATESPIIGYLIQPTDGSAAQAVSPSAEMLNHVGQRMWVEVDDRGQAQDFGIIGGF